MRKPAAPAAVPAPQALVVSGHKGRAVQVDPRPTCPHCGRRVGEYFGLPWSVRCPECGKQARRD